MCVDNIIEFIANCNEKYIEYSKIEEYENNDIVKFNNKIIFALCKKFKTYTILESTTTYVVVKIKDKIFNCRIFYNFNENSYYWNVELEKNE